MKIVLVTPAHPLRGGIAASSERLAAEFQQLGHEVVLFSFSYQYPAFLFPGKTQFTDTPPPAGLDIRTCLHSLNPLNWWTSGRKIALENPDLVVCRFWLPFLAPCLGTVLRIARRFSRKPMRIAGLVDNLVPHEKRPGDTLLARYFTSACDGFVCMSQAVASDLHAFAPGKPVRFSPHPLYDIYGEKPEKVEACQALGLPPDKPLVLFFGFVRAYKGLDLLLHALADPALKRLDVHAAVAGEFYDDPAPYRRLIDENALHERVHLFDTFIPDDRVRLFFGAADLVVQPYRTATQSGISQIAFHFDKPMVVTRVGGLPEIVTDGVSGYVVHPTPAALADAVADFFEHRREAALVEGVKKEKTRFSWRNLVEQLLFCL